MEEQNLKIEWIKQIAANQRYRSTWEAVVNGEKSIVKRICAEGKKLDELTQSLRKQVSFSEILNTDEQKGICLFDTMLEADGDIAFVRRWCEGETLEQLLHQKRFTTADAVMLMIKIARIVSLAHSHNVTHGDLKPANIIVSASEEVTIIDWDTMTIDNSIEEFHDNNHSLSLDQVVGTPQYMPVEQFQGDLDFKCDIYALGVILYQLLTGETPFDSAGSMTATQMAIFKQNHEPESIVIKFPELGITQDLANVIEQSLKNDRNRRIQSVDDFMQKLQNIGKITASKTAEGVPVTPSTPTVEEELPQGKEHKLVLIGHTGAGKTVLVAGLYASQDKDFSVDDPGAKTETGIHAINVRSIIEDGHWPAATSIGDITDLKFKINYKGRQECIEFPEYAGERLNMEGFDKLILGKPDGAFILLNPGSELLQKTHDRLELLSKIKEYISKLGEMPQKPPVALVITASDRLDSDLAEFAPKFEKYVVELTNSLETHIGSDSYKRFNVSVSGRLENQNKPKLEPKGIKEPFIWLIEQFDHKAHVASMRKLTKYVACIVAILTIFVLGKLGQEYYFLNKLQTSFAKCQKEFNKLESKGIDEMIDHRKALVDLRKKYCSLKHIDHAQRCAPCTSDCQPWFMFPKIHKSFDKTILEVEESIDKINHDYFSKRLNAALAEASPDNRKVLDELRAWCPLQAKIKNDQTQMLKKANDELPLAIVRYDAKLLEKRYNKLIDSPVETFPNDLTIASWQGNELLPEQERNQILKKLQELEKRARMAVENCHYTKLISALNAISTSFPSDLFEKIKKWNEHTTSFISSERASKDKAVWEAYYLAVLRVLGKQNQTTEQLVSLVAQYKGMSNIVVNGISDVDIADSKTKMNEQLINCIISHLQTLHNTYSKEQMSKDTFSEPSYPKSIRDSVFPHLTNKDKDTINKKITELIATTRSQWNQKQEQIIDEFIATIKWNNVEDALDELKGFFAENRQNPFLYKAENEVLEKVTAELKKQIKEFDYSESSFRKLKLFCSKVRGTNSLVIQKTSSYKFANIYCDWMEQNPSNTITISKIECSTTFPEGAYIKRSEYAAVNIGSKATPNWYNIISNCESVFRSSYYQSLPQFTSITVDCKPWQAFLLDFNPWENRDGFGKTFWGIDQELKYRCIEIDPGINKERVYLNDVRYNKISGSYVDVSFDRISLRIYFQITGKTLNDLITEAGL